MGAFKHHSYFVKEKHLQSFLFPHICLDCRKSFKKPWSAAVRSCPQCGASLIAVSRKFSAPKTSDIKQWSKVRLLVTNGFLFQRVHDGNQSVRYPKTLEEAKGFIAKYSKQAAARAV